MAKHDDKPKKKTKFMKKGGKPAVKEANGNNKKVKAPTISLKKKVNKKSKFSVNAALKKKKGKKASLSGVIPGAIDKDEKKKKFVFKGSSV